MTALTRLLEKKSQQREPLAHGDLYLLRDVVGYLHDYPERVHHPTEDYLFRRLSKRAAAARSSVQRLRRDHEAVAAATQSLLQLLDAAIRGLDRERDQAVRAECLAFAEQQRGHMQFENQELFPLALEKLQPADWRDIESRFESREDPLFGSMIGNRHRLLYEYLAGPEARAARSLAQSPLFSLEKLILAAGILEDGAASWLARLGRLGNTVVQETRDAAEKTLHPEDLASTLALPLRYSFSVGNALLRCGGDLAGISAAAARDTLALFLPRTAKGAGGEAR